MKNLKMATLGSLLTGILVGISTGVFASDHGDTPLLISSARHDARLTDVLILQRGDKLAFIIDSNPTIQQQLQYTFPTDVTFKSYIDNHTQPLFTDPFLTPILGGTFADPSQIREDVVLTYTFDASNTMSVKLSSPVTELGVSGFYPEKVASGALVYVLGSGFVPQSRNAPQNTWVRVGEEDVRAFVLSSNILVFVAPEEHSGRITIINAANSVTTASPLTVLKTEGGRRSTVTQRVLGMIRNNDPAIAAIAAGDFPSLAKIGLPVQTFSGMRDDMFIRGPQKGRNIAVIAAEMPISLFTTGRQKTLVAWGTANVEGVAGTPFAAGHEEIAGRSFGSMFSPEQSIINTLPPSQHVSATSFLGPLPGLVGRTVPPDVIIFDTTKPQRFPNGRELNDDIIDLIAPNDTRVEGLRAGEEARCLASPPELRDLRDCPTVNDVPHSATFPYLGLPHDHPPTTIP